MTTSFPPSPPRVPPSRLNGWKEVAAHFGQGLTDSGDFPPPGNIWYDLAPDLRPMRAELTAEFVASHQRLEKAGKLDHPLGDAERTEVWPVLVYDGNRFVPVFGPPAR